MNKVREFMPYFLLIIVVLILGLASRRYASILPDGLNLYLGDALWALMVYLGWGLLLRRQPPITIALVALAFSFSIELSQLYHAPWIDSLRHTTLGGLILGFGFLWRDLVAYTMGVGVGFFTEKHLL